jgi:ABC-type amino acid transport substrate-binding protein
MNTSRARHRLAGAALLCFLVPACATDVRTGAQEAAYPKFAALAVDGKPAVGGLCVDIMRAIERVEPDIRFVGDQQWLPFSRLESGVAHGQFDLACGLLRTPEREARHSFIDTPLFPVNYLLVVRANDDVQVRNWADVRQLGEQGVVLTMHGYAGVLAHMKSVGGLRIDAGGRDTRVNLEKLLAGRGRFFVHRSPGVYSEVARSGLQDKVKVLPTVMYTESFYMMVARGMASETRSKIDRALARLAASGELASLARLWADADRNQELRPGAQVRPTP